MRRAWLAGFFLVAACAAASSDRGADFGDRIDALFAAYDRLDRPGYAIGVIRGGELVHAKGYGAADIEAETPITADTAFNLASLSKQFTGAALALDVQSGRVELDDPLSMHLDGLPGFMAPITLGHLAYMTSGLKEYYTLPSPRGGWESEDGFTVEDAIAAVFASGELEFTPGAAWSYSNINYQLLAETSAKLSEASFADHMQAAVFAPLAMADTWVDAPLQPDRPRRASAYVWDDQARDWRLAPRRSAHYGGSGVFSSLQDLARWDAALYRDEAFGREFTSLLLARRPYEHDKTNDALGLVHGRYQGFDTIWYEGGDYGVSTYMIRLPERDETVICLSNFGGGGCRGKAFAVIDLLLAYEPALRGS